MRRAAAAKMTYYSDYQQPKISTIHHTISRQHKSICYSSQVVLFFGPLLILRSYPSINHVSLHEQIILEFDWSHLWNMYCITLACLIQWFVSTKCFLCLKFLLKNETYLESWIVMWLKRNSIFSTSVPWSVISVFWTIRSAHALKSFNLVLNMM